MKILDACGTAIRDHKAIRRIVLAIILALMTWVILQVFDDVTKITAPVAAALSTVVGLLSVPIGFYFRDRAEEDKK